MAETTDPDKAAARAAVQRELANRWDRLGQFLQNNSEVERVIVARNLDLWASVSSRLRTPGYSRDDAATDAMNLMLTGLRNAQDLWAGLTAPVERENVATALPTAFLFFDWLADGGHELVDVTVLRVPGPQGQRLPASAHIALSGTSDDGAQALRAALTVRQSPDRPGCYLIEAVAHPTNALRAGSYDGFVYITDPPRPLANLRIVVESDPEDKDHPPVHVSAD